jgi:DNA-binding IclR family transcriptional regulator
MESSTSGSQAWQGNGVEKGVLARYALVLDAMAAAPVGLTFAEIMRATGLPRGTLHRLLGALAQVGYVDRGDHGKVYALGRRLLALLHRRTPRETLAEMARPVLDALAARFGETAFLARLEGERVESAAMVLPGRERHSYVQPGREMPLHAAASAKAIFAFQPEAIVARVLQRPRVAFTPASRTGRRQVLAELATVRAKGYAACLDELDPGITSYACPIHVQGGVFHSVGLVGLTPRLERVRIADIVAVLQAAADELGRRLSGDAAPFARPNEGAPPRHAPAAR